MLKGNTFHKQAIKSNVIALKIALAVIAA